uniref:Uncharacterized protein n=1 Tax=Rhizophora mucronata TaxID=61149 RepID=A0A2P2J4I3_RHIMU
MNLCVDPDWLTPRLI